MSRGPGAKGTACRGKNWPVCNGARSSCSPSNSSPPEPRADFEQAVTELERAVRGRAGSHRERRTRRQKATATAQQRCWRGVAERVRKRTDRRRRASDRRGARGSRSGIPAVEVESARRGHQRRYAAPRRGCGRPAYRDAGRYRSSKPTDPLGSRNCENGSNSSVRTENAEHRTSPLWIPRSKWRAEWWRQPVTTKSTGLPLFLLGNALASPRRARERHGAAGGGGRRLSRGAEERTRERVPLDWAMTQNNLGIALRSPRRARERHGAAGGGGRRLSRGAGGTHPRARAARLGDDAEQSRHCAPERSASARAARRGWRRRSPPIARRWRNGRASACRSIGRRRRTISAMRSGRSASARAARRGWRRRSPPIARRWRNGPASACRSTGR